MTFDPSSRPAWLPEPFDTPQELAAAYRRLMAERASDTRAVGAAHGAGLGGAAAPAGPLGEDEPAAAAPTASAAPHQAGEEEPRRPGVFGGLFARQRGEEAHEGCVDCDAMRQEFAQSGRLSPTSYAKLQSVGIPPEIVDEFIAGQAARAQARGLELAQMVGGPERLEALLQWAQATLSDGERAAVDAAMSGTDEQARIMLRGLSADYEAKHGPAEPQLIGGAGPIGGARFENAQQVVDAMRDPRYRRDESYREQVKARLARSNVF